MSNLRSILAAAFALGVTTAPASAAFIIIDDTDPNTITITAGDFEEGFSVNGDLLTSGLGDSGSITLPDDGYSIDGKWIDLGQAGGAVNLYFAFPDGSDQITSGFQARATTDGEYGTIGGSFGGFTGFTYFLNPPPNFNQGEIADGSFPFLSIRFISEPVPAPGALALLGLGVLGLGLRRR